METPKKNKIKEILLSFIYISVFDQAQGQNFFPPSTTPTSSSQFSTQSFLNFTDGIFFTHR